MAQALKWITGAGREPAHLTGMFMILASDEGITVEEMRERLRQQ